MEKEDSGRLHDRVDKQARHMWNKAITVGGATLNSSRVGGRDQFRRPYNPTTTELKDENTLDNN